MLSRESELYLKGMRLEKDDVDMLLSSLEGTVGINSEKMRIQLIAYYFNAAQNDAENFAEHARHVLWFVENKPGDFVLTRSWAQISRDHCPDDLAAVTKVWQTIADNADNALDKTKDPMLTKHNIEVLRNAAAQLTYAKDKRAAKLIGACRQLEPESTLWSELETLV